MAKPSLQRFTLDGQMFCYFRWIACNSIPFLENETELPRSSERYHVATESVAFQPAIIMKSAVVETLSHDA